MQRRRVANITNVPMARILRKLGCLRIRFGRCRCLVVSLTGRILLDLTLGHSTTWTQVLAGSSTYDLDSMGLCEAHVAKCCMYAAAIVETT